MRADHRGDAAQAVARQPTQPETGPHVRVDLLLRACLRHRWPDECAEQLVLDGPFAETKEFGLGP